MSNYDKPLPIVTEEARPFWEACRKHKFILQKCKECGHVQYYPRLLCAECWTDSLEWVDATGKGVVYSYTAVHRAPMPGFRPDVPYIIALIDLEEGVRMMSNVIKCKPEEVRVGMPVTVEFEDIAEDIGLPKFKPAE